VASGVSANMQQNNRVESQFQIHPAPRAGVQRRDQPRVPAVASGCLPRITQVLALAMQFREMIRCGEARDCADLARLGGLTRERISQIMKLLWLAAEIQVDILYLPPTPGGRFPVSEVAIRKIANRFAWPDQNEEWINLKKAQRLS
jgi:hypothetical protein